MNRTISLLFTARTSILPALVGLTLSACASHREPPAPVQGGTIGTLPLGHYTCELPGDAGGPVGKPVPDYAFRVVNSSSYKTAGVRGSYLYTGDRVVMTGGKLKGLKLHRLSDGFLRRVEADGSDGEMRCVLRSRR